MSAHRAAEKAARTTQEDIPICPGCSEANGTNGWAVVRHDPPLCKTSAEQAAINQATAEQERTIVALEAEAKILHEELGKHKPLVEALQKVRDPNLPYTCVRSIIDTALAPFKEKEEPEP